MVQLYPFTGGDADQGGVRVEGGAVFRLGGRHVVQPGDLALPGDVALLAEPEFLGFGSGKRQTADHEQNRGPHPHYLVSMAALNFSVIALVTDCMCS